MGVFFVLLFVPVMIQHFVWGKKHIDQEKKNQAALLFFLLFLAALVMLRHESVGNDTRNYISIFYKISGMDWGDVAEWSAEYGFSFFNKFVSLFSSEPQFFFSIVTIATMVMFFPTYRRLNMDTSLTIVLFCTMSTFVMMFSGIRQMLAIGIGFIAYEFTRKKKLIPFIIAVVVAMTFHTSAFMLVFMYPLYHAKITKKWLYVVVPTLIILFAFNVQIFSVLALFLEQYTRYDGSISSTGAYTMIILFALFTVFSFLIPDEKKMDEETVGLRNFLLFSLILQMFAPLHTLAMRMNYYYIIFIPLLIPKIIQCRSERWAQVAVVGRHVMVVFFLVYFFYNAYTGSANLNVFPYHFFWENVG